MSEYGDNGPVLSSSAGSGIRQLQESFIESAVQGKDQFAAAATRALLEGTARLELAHCFQASGTSIAELAARVGHSERVARRLVASKELLNEANLSAYFRAIGE